MIKLDKKEEIDKDDLLDEQIFGFKHKKTRKCHHFVLITKKD